MFYSLNGSCHLLRTAVAGFLLMTVTPGLTSWALAADDTSQPVTSTSDSSQTPLTPANIEQQQPTHIFIDGVKDSPTNKKYVETDGTIQLAPMQLTDFAKGSWSFQTYGSMTVSDDSDSLYLGHVGAGYFFADGLSLNFEVVGGLVDGSNENQSTGGDFAASGFDLLFRWHALRGDGWSIYAEGGAGAIYTSKSFPSDGTQFNFSPQIGVGATLRVLGNARLMGGVRYHHISNASIYRHGRNPGFDGIMMYAGLMIPF